MSYDQAGSLFVYGGAEQAPPRIFFFLARGVHGRDRDGSRRESGRRRDTRPVGRESDGDFALFAV